MLRRLDRRSARASCVSCAFATFTRAATRGATRAAVRLGLGLAAVLPAVAGADTGTPAVPAPLAVKVMVVNMFPLEAQPWLAALQPVQDYAVPGLPAETPNVRCNADAVCQLTTGMGHAGAAASMTALLYNPQFDLRKTWFLVAGIAGIDPAQGTLGTAAWAHYVIDFGLTHEIDAREMPPRWSGGYFGILTTGPGIKPKLEYRSEVFALNPALQAKAYALSAHVKLADSAAAQAYRAHYKSSPAKDAPQVTRCDTLSSDTWWSGAKLGAQAGDWTRLLTDGQGRYCTTQQEDNATLLALTRAAASGRADVSRVAILRSGSDFDRPYPGQSAYAALRAGIDSQSGGFPLAVQNLVVAGKPLVDDIVAHWAEWQNGVPTP